jgi:SAM-dependent methyltransferase
MNVVCPLCTSANVLLTEKIKVADLMGLYKEGEIPPLELDVTSEFDSLTEIGFYHCLDCDLQFFYPMVTGSELFYEKLQEFKWYYMDDKDEYEYASQFINQSDVVLEIGSGKGSFAKRISVKHYTGLELSQTAIELASKDGILVLHQSIQNHANTNGEKYDVVCAFQVLEHIAGIRSFITSSIACLKPGGLLIYSVPSADSFVSMVTNNVLNMPPHHMSWWSDECLSSVARIFGIELVEIKHEKLIGIHRQVYAFSIVLESLRKLLGVERKLLDRSVRHKILEKIAKSGGRFLAKGLLDPRVLPDGHSVNVVYQKPNKHNR